MTRYEDTTVVLDDAGVTIKNYGRPGSTRTIDYSDIRRAELIDLGFGTGRYRLVGISPGRLRTFFHWDLERAHKPVAISLDTGRWLRRAITPDDPERVLAILEAAMT